MLRLDGCLSNKAHVTLKNLLELMASQLSLQLGIRGNSRNIPVAVT